MASPLDHILIRGAKTHNLKNINVDLPHNQLIVMTGVSGSGKSSLAFDTLYAEGQRRYVESLSSYARQFLQLMPRPDVDSITGLSPAIAIDQKTTSHNPRSTIGTVTEIYDYLRLLFARIGTPYCPRHPTRPLIAQTISQMVDDTVKNADKQRIMILAPLTQTTSDSPNQFIEQYVKQGFVRFRIKNNKTKQPPKIYEADALPQFQRQASYCIDVVVDRLRASNDAKGRLAESYETALNIANGQTILVNLDTEEETFLTNRFACPHCGYAVFDIEPRMFSFNSAKGACPSCEGLGVVQSIDSNSIIKNPELSIAQGGLHCFEPKNKPYMDVLRFVEKNGPYKFLQTPIKDLDKKVLHFLFYGGKEMPEIRYDIDDTYFYNVLFNGIVYDFEQKREHEKNFFPNKFSKKFRPDLISRTCPDCHGTRLQTTSRFITVGTDEQEKTISEITALSIHDSLKYFTQLKLAGAKKTIAERILHEITSRLHFLNNVGLHYLTLDRGASTLSGGEAQRIRLASQIGSGLTGVMYVLDEPSIGLHQCDNDRLLQSLRQLRDLGNTVIVVEHDEDAIRCADHIVDIGPGAGVHGGNVIAQGSLNEILASKESITAQYLTGEKQIAIPQKRHKPTNKVLTISGARTNNLKDITVSFPLGLLICITGVSGSGKSSLINETLLPALKDIQTEHHQNYDTLSGFENLGSVIAFDQSPLGRTPRSNPATYTGVFTPIRELFASTPLARERGYTPARFSFNMPSGRCIHCQGDGLHRVSMHFLPDVFVTCDVCQGTRYNRETLQVTYRGKNIADVLNMTVEEASKFFSAIPTIASRLQTLLDVGLGYIQLGQSSTTLSGGEAQRIKLAFELSKRSKNNSLYILDEPTTGLHFHDIDLLLKVLHRFRDNGSTVIIIEHNLDVIKTADWIIDLGPGGGSHGGQIIAQGTPEDIIRAPQSQTGHYLGALLQRQRKMTKA